MPLLLFELELLFLVLLMCDGLSESDANALAIIVSAVIDKPPDS